MRSTLTPHECSRVLRDRVPRAPGAPASPSHRLPGLGGRDRPRAERPATSRRNRRAARARATRDRRDRFRGDEHRCGARPGASHRDGWLSRTRNRGRRVRRRKIEQAQGHSRQAISAYSRAIDLWERRGWRLHLQYGRLARGEAAMAAGELAAAERDFRLGTLTSSAAERCRGRGNPNRLFRARRPFVRTSDRGTDR